MFHLHEEGQRRQRQRCLHLAAVEHQPSPLIGQEEESVPTLAQEKLSSIHLQYIQ